jgi:lysophospholipase L1-like esterase
MPPGPSIALVRFPHTAEQSADPLQAFFSTHTGELHASVARPGGWLGSNFIVDGTHAPAQGASVVAFLSSPGVLEICYVDAGGTLCRIEQRALMKWSAPELLPAPAAPAGAGLAVGHLPLRNDFVLLTDRQGRVGSLRLRGAAAGPLLEQVPGVGGLAVAGGALVAFNQSSGLLSVVFCQMSSRRLVVIWRSAVDMQWQGPAHIDALAPALLPADAALAVAVLADTHCFVFHVDDAGRLRAAHVVGTAAWQAPQMLSVAGFAPPGAGVAALQQTSDLLSAFVVDTEGAVQRFWRHSGDAGWAGPQRLTAPDAARPGASLTAAKQDDNESVLVFVATDGRPSICWTFGDGAWQGPALISRYRIDEPYVPHETHRVSLTKVLSAPMPSPVQDSVSPLPGSARFVTWVTGPKSANGQPFYTGADLGANTEHRRPGDRSSRLFIFFGDTTVDEKGLPLHDPAAVPPYDGDMIGIVEAERASALMPMAIVRGPAQGTQAHPGDLSFHPYTMQRAGTLGTVETPTGAFSHAGRLFVFAEVNAHRPVCYLTSSARPDSADAFDIHFEVSRTRFIQVAPWVVANARHPGLPSTTGEGVVMIGRGAAVGETDSLFLAWMPIQAGLLPSKAGLLFYAGVDSGGLSWSHLESAAVPIAGRQLQGYSSVSLNWIDGPDRWVLTYTRGKSSKDPNPARDRLGPIVARVARYLHEWSDEVPLFDPRHDTAVTQANDWNDADSWAYGPFLLSRFHEWDLQSSTLTLRYLASTSVPYQVQMLSAQIAIEGALREHVFHRSADDHVQHLHWDSATGLVACEDWSASAAAPAAASSLAALATLGRLSVFYRDARGGLVHLFLDTATGDVHLAASDPPTLPQAAAGNPVLLETPGQLHAFYRGVDGSLQHIVKNLSGSDAEPDAGANVDTPASHRGTLALVGPFTGTGVDDWTRAAKAPPLAGDPAVTAAAGQQHAFYRTANGTIQHIVWSASGGFGTDDWTTRSGAPRAAGDPVVLFSDGEQHVFHRGANGAILHLHWNPSLSVPASEDWTALSGAPLAAGEPAALYASGQLHVFYRSATGHVLHLVRNPGDARPGIDDWTGLAAAPLTTSDPAPLETPGQQHVFYRAEDGAIDHILWQDPATAPHGVFAKDNWTQRARAPLAIDRPAVLLSNEVVQSPPPTRILTLGDSITQGFNPSEGLDTPHGGYRAPLFELARGAGRSLAFVGSLFDGPLAVDGVRFPRAHEGHAGWNSHGITSIAADVARRTRPQIVLLMVGTNDVRDLANNLADTTSRLSTLIGNLRSSIGDALVVIAKIPPMADGNQAGLAERVDSYNRSVAALFERRRVKDKRLALVDMHTGFNLAWLSDGVHPNSSGYAHMAAVWFDAIRTHLRQ